MIESLSDTGLELKWLLFEMHEAGYTQNAMAAYLGKGKKTINEIKTTSKWERKEDKWLKNQFRPQMPLCVG